MNGTHPVRRTYLAIDLKSFYASVEAVSRGKDPLRTNLVVADASRTEKTICLAVSPSLKAYGIPGRARLFEVVQRVREVNAGRRRALHGRPFSGSSDQDPELRADPRLELAYITAVPRMKLYMEVSSRIYDIYLRYIAAEDIIVYSIDEVFIDVTEYLATYRMSAHAFCRMLIREVLKETGITATGGIGTNLYLAKVAMDIVAKHIPADQDGVRIAELDERSYREQLWTHRPLTDFWRVGRGYARKLEAQRIYTMGDIARCSVGEKGTYYSEELLYKLFGVNAELLIDHAWGYEPCMVRDIKAYKPENNSLGAGQVLHCPYAADGGRLIVREMADLLSLDLVEKKLQTDQLVLTVGYDIENLTDPERRKKYYGEVVTDWYGRQVPKHAHGTENLGKYTSSSRLIADGFVRLYDRIVDPELLIRRVTITANHVIDEKEAEERRSVPEQLELFTDYAERDRKQAEEEQELRKERKVQEAVLELKRKFGKNTILKGMNLREGGTTIARNRQIGGHAAGGEERWIRGQSAGGESQEIGGYAADGENQGG